MRYPVSEIDRETGAVTPAEMAAIHAFNARMRTEGRFRPRVQPGGAERGRGDRRGAAAMFAPGPLVAPDECVAGFWALEAASLDEACALATEASRCRNRKVELRASLGG